ncbi:hypothetical protein ElyMa_006016600 [Elysia marginata]|uniref:Uncharacterized protein n=1 Tax=Elysia marginata TaxID=1093978 RepID=A0AAV4GKP8_9GAST|nr:hypothetical protein ElyMa_006016600 [Elysia marginata]
MSEAEKCGQTASLEHQTSTYRRRARTPGLPIRKPSVYNWAMTPRVVMTLSQRCKCIISLAPNDDDGDDDDDDGHDDDDDNDDDEDDDDGHDDDDDNDDDDHDHFLV